MVARGANQALPHIVFRLSPKADIAAGAAVKVDEQQPFRVPISQCDSAICEVRAPLPEVFLGQMRTGKLLRFAFFIDNKQLTYPVSLDGFDGAYGVVNGPQGESN